MKGPFEYHVIVNYHVNLYQHVVLDCLNNILSLKQTFIQRRKYHFLIMSAGLLWQSVLPGQPRLACQSTLLNPITHGVSDQRLLRLMEPLLTNL